jgi:phage gp45-like
MSVRLPSGGILPSGLMSRDLKTQNAGFEKKFNNNSLRIGVVIASYPTTDKQNIGKLTTEYDVLVMEQNQNKSITPLTYRNCISMEGLGSIADYFEKTFRKQKKSKNKVSSKSILNQDGAIVFLLCLDGSSEKGIIIGAAPHPNRNTKLKQGQVMAGEFNGISILVNEDGSANLSFKGATNNDGTPVDKSQGTTSIDIEKDGTLQIKNKGVTTRLEKAGNVLLSLAQALSINAQKDASLSANAVSVKTTGGDVTVSSAQKIALEASGSAAFKAGEGTMEFGSSLAIKSQSLSINSNQVSIKGTSITLDGRVAAGGMGGLPAVTLMTKFFGVGALGIPVISNAIGPFSTKVTIV